MILYQFLEKKISDIYMFTLRAITLSNRTCHILTFWIFFCSLIVRTIMRSRDHWIDQRRALIQ